MIKEKEQWLKKEIQLIKREEKQENIKRINRANEYAKEQMKKQMKDNDLRVQSIQSNKN